MGLRCRVLAASASTMQSSCERTQHDTASRDCLVNRGLPGIHIRSGRTRNVSKALQCMSLLPQLDVHAGGRRTNEATYALRYVIVKPSCVLQDWCAACLTTVKNTPGGVAPQQPLQSNHQRAAQH